MVETANQMNKDEKKKRKERLIKWGVVALCELFTLISLIYFIASGKYDRLWTCCWTFLIVLIPVIAVKLFHFEINLVFFIVCELYCLAPMLGHSYHFYYLFSWWDDVLHGLGGVVFAVLGVCLMDLLNKGEKVNLLTTALFALFFSITVSVLWEMVEYGADLFLGADMQKDTFISKINSYLLGGKLGELGTIDKIDEIIINGTKLEGYIDIGLIDTMTDMMVETLGAVCYFIWLLIDRNRHPILLVAKKE